ncbi:hypothetical protein Hanom_Chr03g00194151 [Helianthus anomalus]
MSFKGLVRELREMRDGIGNISRRRIEGSTVNWRNRTRSHITFDVALVEMVIKVSGRTCLQNCCWI